MTFKQDYSEYLQSKHWKDLAEETRRLAGYRCQVCNSDDHLEVHHRTYERKGDEHQSDLVCLCHECHERFHVEKKQRGKNKKKIMMPMGFIGWIDQIVLCAKDGEAEGAEDMYNEWLEGMLYRYETEYLIEVTPFLSKFMEKYGDFVFAVMAKAGEFAIERRKKNGRI